MRPPLFQAALGADWDRLAPEVRAFHDLRGVAVWEGRAEVVRGRGPLARLAARLARFPPAGQGVPVRLTLTELAHGERWERAFGSHRYRSVCLPSPVPGRTRERMGALTFELAWSAADGAMALDLRRGWFLGLPLPRRLLPPSRGVESGCDGRYRFDIDVTAPLGGGLVVRYRGWLEPVTGGTRPG